jgi:putative phosphoesterase
VKLGVISDVHGDDQALFRALRHLTELGASRIVCAGDVVGYGPNPDAVVALLGKHQVISIRGNHDRWALQRPPGTPDEFGGGRPGPATLEFLRGLPPDLVIAADKRLAVIVHGSPRGDMEYLTIEAYPPAVLERTLASLGADLLVAGHTHVPMWYRCEQGLVVNPGSIITRPYVRSSRSFALVDLDELTVTFHHVQTSRPIEVAPWTEEASEPADWTE